MTTFTHDGFQKGSGCFPCEDCGKLTRRYHGDTGTGFCKPCQHKVDWEIAVDNSQCPECSGEMKRYETNYSDWVCKDCDTMFDDNGDKAVKHRTKESRFVLESNMWGGLE